MGRCEVSQGRRCRMPGAEAVMVAPPPLFSWYSQVLPRCFCWPVPSELTSQAVLPPGPIVPWDRGVGPGRDEQSERQAYNSDSQPADGRPAIEQMGEYDALHNSTMSPPRDSASQGRRITTCQSDPTFPDIVRASTAADGRPFIFPSFFNPVAAHHPNREKPTVLSVSRKYGMLSADRKRMVPSGRLTFRKPLE